MVDTHCHLQLCTGDTTQIVNDATKANITRILTVGLDTSSSKTGLSLSEKFPQVFVSVGLHPNNADQFNSYELAKLEELAIHPRCVAIGETGFDFYRAGASEENQEKAFIAQMELARELDKPLVIHTRAATDRTISTLTKKAGGLKIIMHCFSIPERLNECIQADWWISFAGNVTYPKSEELRKAAMLVPNEKLLVETDSPYLSPQAVRGKPNEPANVIQTAQLLAQIRNVPIDELDRIITANAAALFKW